MIGLLQAANRREVPPLYSGRIDYFRLGIRPPPTETVWTRAPARTSIYIEPPIRLVRTQGKLAVVELFFEGTKLGSSFWPLTLEQKHG